jgi:hypothetical protein
MRVSFFLTRLFNEIKILYSFSKTIYTVSVFWVFENKEGESEKTTNYINDQLNKHSGAISGQMCRDLELRRGPKIRFYPSQTGPQLQEMREGMATEVPEMLREEQLKKWRLTEEKVQKNPAIKKALEHRVGLHQVEIQEGMEMAISNKTWLKDAGRAYEAVQSKPQAQPKERFRDNRNPDGSRKKYKKKHRADVLWQDIMAE